MTNLLTGIIYKKKYFTQVVRQLSHKLFLRHRVTYQNILCVSGNYKLNLDNSSSKILFGRNVSLRDNCNFLAYSNGMIIISEGVFLNNDCSLNCLKRIEIGKNTIMGESVKIYDHNHEFRNIPLLIKNQGFNFGEIKIGKNCWIGSNVIILKGVTIGDNSVIGAGCIIHKDIPADSIVKNINNLEIYRINL